MWLARDLVGGRRAQIGATVRVRDGVVWGKDFTAVIPHREGYPLIAIAQTTRDFGLNPSYSPHPNIRLGRPGGCETCQELWAKVTPYASADEVQDAFAFDLSCIGATLRRCSGMSQIMPGAARLIQEDSKSYNQGRQPALPRSPAMIRAFGRDAENTAIAKVVRVGHEQSTVTMDRIELVDYQVIEVLKGTFTTPALHATFYPNATTETPDLRQHVIVFGSGNDNVDFSVLLTDSNLQEVRRGLAEDAVDIPRRR